MDSRIIYSASEKMKGEIYWPKLTDTEWIYFGSSDEINEELVSERINSHFSDSDLYVAWTRDKSFESTKQNIIERMGNILGSENFIVWNSAFTEAIEFNKIGVLRCGKYIKHF